MIPQNLIQNYGWPMSFNIAFVGAGFILVGALLKAVLMNDRNDKTGVTVLMMIIMLALTVLFAELNIAAKEIDIFGKAVMAWAEYGTYSLFLMSGICGSLFIVLLSKLVERVCWVNSYLSRIGENTMIILAIHFTVMMPFEKLGNHFTALNHMAYLCIAVIAVALICSWAAELIERIVPSLSKGKWPVDMNVRRRIK